MTCPSNVEFTVVPKQLILCAKTNGDKITIMDLVLNAEQAAAMAYLINQPKPLKIEIKTETE